MRRREGSFVLFSLSSLRSFVHRLDGMKLVFFSLSQVFEVTSGDRILLESLAAILTLFYLLFPSTSSYWLGKRTTDWQIGCGPRLGAMRFIIGHLLLCDYRSAFMKKRKWRKKSPRRKRVIHSWEINQSEFLPWCPVTTSLHVCDDNWWKITKNFDPERRSSISVSFQSTHISPSCR